LKLRILGCDKNFFFKADSDEKFENFLVCLNFNIKNSRGGKENMVGVALRPIFYKHFFISESDYIKESKTGDLLIFKGFDCPSTCQRCLTGAEYDHIALLIKTNDILKVYESTSKDGCKMREWNDFIRYSWYVLYEKMVLRKLVIKADETKKKEIINKLEEKILKFVETTEKKPYRMTCDKLCCSRIKGSKDYEKNNDWDKCKGFFCSQLVAAGLMAADIIQNNKCSGQFLPGQFAELNELNYSDLFEYGPEIIIDFSL